MTLPTAEKAQEGHLIISPDTIEAVGVNLPSFQASLDFFKGNASSIGNLAFVTLGRSVEIAAGIAATGNWSKDSWKHALGGSLAVQGFILAYALASKHDANARLPSEDSARAIIDGKPGAIQTATIHWLGRSLFVGLGMYAAGSREKVTRQALAGGAAIEASVLLWVLYQKQNKSQP